MVAIRRNTARPIGPLDTRKITGPDGSYYDEGAMQVIPDTLGHVLVGNASVTGNLQIPDQIYKYLLNNSGNVANLTVTLPNNPYDSQNVTITETGAGNLTGTLTIQGGAPTGGTQASVQGVPTTLNTLTSVNVTYDAASTTWYRS